MKLCELGGGTLRFGKPELMMDLGEKIFCVAAITFRTIITIPCFAQSKPVSTEEAALVAANWLMLGQERQWGWPGVITSKASDAKTLERGGDILGYCFETGENGYIVIPACRELPPITAYSTDSRLKTADEDGFAGLLKDVLQAKRKLVQAVLDPGAPAEWLPLHEEIKNNRRLWAEYCADYRTFIRAVESFNYNRAAPERRERQSIDDDISPLLTTFWHSSAPYNASCPLSDTVHCAAGCIATASSAIMFYWRYPVAGFGTHSYFWDGDQTCDHNTAGEVLFVDCSDSYDWANMLDTYTASASDAQKAAVAELFYEAGVTINMDYGSCASTGLVYSIMESMPSHFGYSSDMHRENRNEYASADAWFMMLRGDLDLRRPIVYRINRHAITCDGWRIAGTNQVHMNYGCGTSYTAWYTVDNLYCPWAGCDPMVEYCIRGIRPSTIFTVTVPNGGETFMAGERDTIRWDPANYFENVRIELNRNFPTGLWEVLAENTLNDGEYAWTVSMPATDSARIRLVGTRHAFLSDTSDAPFAVSLPSGINGIHFDTLLYADHDAYIHAGYPTYNYGRRDSLLAGQSSVNAVYTLLHFDLSGLDSGLTIASVVCSLYVNSSSGGPVISLYRVNDDWFEGAKSGGAAADSHECCWNWRGYGSGSVTNGTILQADCAWGIPVIGPETYGSANVSGTGWFSWYVTDLVQALVDAGPESAYGIAAYSPSPGTNAWCRFNSREFTNKPRLRVTGYYYVPILPQPTVVAQVEDGFIRLHWVNTGAPAYNVYAASSVSGPYTLMQTTTDTFLTVSTVDTAAVQCFYQVCATTE